MKKSQGRGSFSKRLSAAAGLLLCAGIGCTAEIGETPSSEELDQATGLEESSEELFRGSHRLFCGGSLQECNPGAVCLSFLGGSCAGPSNLGLCLPKPRRCAPITRPVCGCDGVTYSNHCEAWKAGTGVDSRGECAPPPPPEDPECGGPNSIPCPGSGNCIEDSSGGVCECKVDDPKCAVDEAFDADPTVCACVAAPCAGVKCPPRTACVVDDNGEAVCQ